MRSKLLLSILVLVACKSDSKDSKDTKDTNDSKEPAAKTGGDPATPPASGLKGLLGDKPSMPVPFAKLKFGMAKADAEKAVPRLFANPPDELAGYQDAAYPGLRFPPPGAELISDLTARFAAAGAADAPKKVAEAWGKETWSGVDDTYGELQCWLDKATKMRGVLAGEAKKSRDLVIGPYTPVLELLDPPIIGQSFDALTKRFGVSKDYSKGVSGSASDASVNLLLPPLECDMNAGTVELQLKDGVVKAMIVRPSINAALRFAFVAKFGQAKEGGVFQEDNPKIQFPEDGQLRIGAVE